MSQFKWKYLFTPTDRAVAKAAQNKRRREFMAFKTEYLMCNPCVDCGETDPLVLDFDHVRGTKEYNVSKMSSKSLDDIEEEIAKCEIRCANCHRIATHERRKNK